MDAEELAEISGKVSALLSMAQEIQKRTPKVPAELFHYTTPEGLLGIVNDRQVWASHLAYLNDRTELDYASNLIRAYLEAKARSVDSAAAALAERCLALLTNGAGLVDVHAFSLSTVPDQLSQWRAYAAQGAGFCLGFDTTRMAISRPPNSSNNSLRLLEVIYDPSTQAKMIDQTFSALSGFLHDERPREVLADLGDLDWPAALALMFGLSIGDLIYTFKDEAFSEEREWRIVSLEFPQAVNKRLKFRIRGSHFVPYVGLSLGRSESPLAWDPPISRIIQGPQLPQPITENGLRKLLFNHGLDRVALERSRIPLR